MPMTHTRPTICGPLLLRVAVSGGAALAVLTLVGCKAAPLIAPWGGLPVFYGAAAFEHGPRVQLVNDSAMPISVRYWAGRRDTSVVGGVADVRTRPELAFEAVPGSHHISQLGRGFQPASNTDVVIWVNLVPAPGSGVQTVDGTPPEPVWLVLHQPQPYVLQLVGDSWETLEVRRTGEAGLSPLPRDRWIDGVNGEYPVVMSTAQR